jgi:hypothetical protein
VSSAVKACASRKDAESTKESTKVKEHHDKLQNIKKQEPKI